MFTFDLVRSPALVVVRACGYFSNILSFITKALYSRSNKSSNNLLKLLSSIKYTNVMPCYIITV